MVEHIYAYALNNGVLLAGIAFFLVFCIDFYISNVKVNLDTDNVDLMERYLWLKMRRRFYDENL